MKTFRAPPQASEGPRAFTIIELLVVVSIIALLVGILLPAIGKAREQSQLTKSQSNVHNIATACVTYAAEFADRQLTYIDDNFSRYGTDGPTAIVNFFTVNGYPHPPVSLGYGQGGIYGTWNCNTPGIACNPQNYSFVVPIDFQTKFGAFRIPNGRQLNTYMNGRFYEPSFYAPKDSAVLASVEQYFDWADEYVPISVTGGIKWSSYCFSPAAMFSPDVLGLNKTTGRYYNNPYSLQAGFRSPAMSQARFPDLKTHIMEHNWCQNRKKTCNPAFGTSTYDNCEPFYFNGSWDSAPVCAFYDGHVEAAGQRDAIDANSRICAQNGQPSQGQNAYKGLWSVDTPMGGTYLDYSQGGYFMEVSLDWSSTSYHVLTIDGIKGRDFIAK